MNRPRPPPVTVRRASSRATPGEHPSGFRRPTLRPPTPDSPAPSDTEDWESENDQPHHNHDSDSDSMPDLMPTARPPPRTGSTTGDRAHPPPSTRAHPPAIGVDEVQGKSCWVCLDDDDDTDSAGQTWVHACHCSLVAHEKCLLVWVASQEQGQSKPGPVCCPQCKEPYTVYESTGLPLAILNIGDNLIGRACAGFILTSLASSFIATSGIIGYSSVRLYLGKRATGLLLGERPPWSWPLWALLAVPLLPYAQITSAFSSDVLSVSNYSMVERGLVLLPIFFLPRPPQSRLAPPWSLAHPRLFTLNWSFPPGPGLTLALLPAVNVAYLNLKRRVQRSVLMGTGLFAPWPARNGRRGRNELEVILGGEDQPFGARLRIELGEDGRQLPPPPPPALADEALYLTRHSVSRLAVGALLAPLASSLAGWGLEQIGRRWSPTLGKFLGLKGLAPITKSDGWLMGTAGALGGRGGWGGWGGPGVEGELDPVWWRNAIGGCLLVLVKDSIGLLHKYLRLQQRRSRRVKSRSFEGLDVTPPSRA